MPTKLPRDRREYFRQYHLAHPKPRREQVTRVCALPGCGLAVTGTARRRYCTPAHRAAAQRLRQKLT